jgi:hypothetical protein
VRDQRNSRERGERLGRLLISDCPHKQTPIPPLASRQGDSECHSIGSFIYPFFFRDSIVDLFQYLVCIQVLEIVSCRNA